MSKRNKQTNYNEEPVTYCSKCYSLKIIHEDAIDEDCCGECGCSDLLTASIDKWEILYEKRYNHRHISENSDISKSPIFLLSLEKLKTKVYQDENWKDICLTLYPNFPGGLSRSDSVILLFAKLCNDNKLDDLRKEMIKRLKHN